MISNAPLLDWLPDESLFSLCTRLHRLWGHPTSGQSAEALFGRRLAGTHHDFPNMLDEFVQRTHGRYGSAEELARDRSLLRFFRPFLNNSKVCALAQTMASPSVAHLKFRMGLLTSRFRANHPLKACQACMRNDLEQYGWVQWHLCHQYPGVWICQIHNEVLLRSTLKSSGVERFLWHLPIQDSLVQDWEVDANVDVNKVTVLAHLITELVEAFEPDGWLDPSSVQVTIKGRLLECGWIKSNGKGIAAEAFHDYVQHCSGLREVPELSMLASTPEQAKLQVNRLIQPLRSGTHPLRLLVAISWLFSGKADFQQAHKLIAQGTARTHENLIEEKKLRFERRSSVERASVVHLISSGFSATSAARKVGVDVGTAMAWAAQNGIQIARRPKIMNDAARVRLVNDLRKGLEKVVAAGQHDVSIQSVTRLLRTEVGLHSAWQAAKKERKLVLMRGEWKKLLFDNPAIGMKLTRSLAPAVYAWLYRHDRAWLTENEALRQSRDLAKIRSSVQWDVRDQTLSQLVQQAVLRLSIANPNKRLRLWQIYQAVPELKAKLSVLDRLVLTKAVLEKALLRPDWQLDRLTLFRD